MVDVILISGKCRTEKDTDQWWMWEPDCRNWNKKRILPFRSGVWREK